MTLRAPITHLAVVDRSNNSHTVSENDPLPVRQYAYEETYKAYDIDIAGNSSFATNEVDIATGLGRPATAITLVADDDVQIKINSTSNDSFIWDVSVAGKVLTIGPGELKVSKLYFASEIPTGSGPNVNIQILAL